MSALCWNIIQRRTVIPYRCFETIYRSHFQGSRNPFWISCLLWRWDRYVVPKRREGFTALRYVISRRAQISRYGNSITRLKLNSLNAMV